MLIRLKKKFQKKKIFYDFIFLSFVLTIYVSPLIFFGLDRIEDYQFSHFTLLILSENYFNPFLFFYDLLGPGTRLPLGSGLNFLFPPSFFISNLNTFYFLTFLLGIYLQLNYLKKTLKFFNIQNKYLFFLLYAFNIEILMQVFIGDSLKTYITVSSFPLIFYYFFKFINLKTRYYFFKLILIVGYIFLNSHEAFVITSSIGFFLLIILNKKFFYFKEKYFYLGVIALILILGENIYRLSYELAYYKDVSRVNVFDLDLKHYSSGIVFFLKFLETTYGLDFPYLSEFKAYDNFWLPFGGIFFYFAFYEAVRLFIKKKSANILYLNVAFIILIFISCVDLSKISFSILNTTFILRDINNFFSLILFGIFLKNLRYNKIIIFVSLIFTAVHVFTTIEYQYKLSKKNEFNFFKNNQNFKESLFSKKIENSLPQINRYDKTYLSPKTWDKIKARNSNIFTEANIFYYNDLIKYNIYPFNTEFKNAHKNQLRFSFKKKMYSNIDPRINEINNSTFLKVFNIDYLLIFEDELSLIDLTNYNVISEIDDGNTKVLFLKLKESDLNMVINDNITLSDDLNCEKKEKAICIINKKNFLSSKSNIKINRISINKYEIFNNTNKVQKIILPFLYDEGWKSQNNKIKNIEKALMYIELAPNTKNVIFYRDYVRIFLKILSFLSLVFLIFFLIKKKI